MTTDSNHDDIVEYASDDSIFRFNKKTKILHINGLDPVSARAVVLQMIKEKWLPNKIKSIWFSGDPALMISGVNTTVYLTAKPAAKKKPERTFTDIVKST
jgi:hypothetical protein